MSELLGTWCKDCGHEERVGGHDCTPVNNAFHKAIRHEILVGRYDLFLKWFKKGWEAHEDVPVSAEMCNWTGAIMHLEILEAKHRKLEAVRSHSDIAVEAADDAWVLVQNARKQVVETSRAWLASGDKS